MYSQNNEEKYIVEFFAGFVGTFLDIGAYNGKTFSNTLRLVELGWSGVCIEPSPSVLPSLMALHQGNSKITICPKAIALTPGKIKFYDAFGDAVSSTSIGHKILWETNAKSKFKEVEVDAMTVDDMLLQFGTSFDFINLDVEGTNWPIFSQLPLENLHCLRLLCVEHDSKIEEIKTKSKQFEFSEIHRNCENLILGRK